MTAGRDRNSPCWWGSGKKMKKCHGGPIAFVGPKTAVLPGGAVLNIHSVQASVPVVKMFPLPVDLLELARWAVEQANRSGSDHRATVMCVLFVAAAAEGILNSLLEPLVPSDEWQDPVRKDRGLNWERPYKKWIKLSEKLKMRPQLDVEKSPLKELLEVFELRNQILHFTLRPNIEQVVVPKKAEYDRGHVTITDHPEIDGCALVDADFGLKAALHPTRAHDYYLALAKVLRNVLPRCEPDPFGFIPTLTKLVREDLDA